MRAVHHQVGMAREHLEPPVPPHGGKPFRYGVLREVGAKRFDGGHGGGGVLQLVLA